MHVWNVLHADRWKCSMQKWRKKSVCAPLHNLVCLAISSQLRHVSANGKKLVKQHCLLHMYLQYGERRPTNGWDRFGSLGHPSKFQWVSRLGFVTATTSLTEGQSNSAGCFAVSWAGTLYIHFRGLLTELCHVQNSLRPSLASSYICSVTVRHCSSGRQPIFAAWYKEWNYGTFAEGATYIRQGVHHVGHRPTFQLKFIFVLFFSGVLRMYDFNTLS